MVELQSAPLAVIRELPGRIAPIFEKKKRKIENKIADWYEGRPAPRIEDRSSSYIENEAGLAYYALGELYRR